MCSAFYTNKFNLNISITNVSFDSDGKGLFSVRVLLEQKEKGSLSSNGKHNKYVHKQS